MAIEGGCRCGRVRYRVALDQVPNAYACHCLDCQTWSGSAFSTQFIVPEDQLAIVAHIWAKRKLAGVEISAGLPTWPEGAPPEDFAAALSR